MRRLGITLIALFVLTPAAVYAVATAATRLQGAYFVPRGANPNPDGGVGFYAQQLDAGTGNLQACNSSNVCYPVAVPQTTAGGSADAGATIGTDTAIKLDTCTTGGTGSTCYRLKDIVNALKITGALAQ